MKAIALISGGLDSILAARMVQEQGIEVIPLHFKVPFCHRSKKSFSPGMRVESLVQRALSLPARTIEEGEAFLSLLENPRHGFGSGVNPCIDCKILMLRTARRLLEEWKARFVITGEVLGQRPMSQHRRALGIIERESGLEGLLLRPLSARCLPETIPEKEGWVARRRLLGFSGRGRRQQMMLAEEFGISDYSNPAGGCLLTDGVYSRRIRDLLRHDALTLENIELLKAGRHFRLNGSLKLVVGRDEEENNFLESLALPGDRIFYPGEYIAGPCALARGVMDDASLSLCCRIVCYYCDVNGARELAITHRTTAIPQEGVVKVSPVEEKMLKSYAI
ncbi:MAG: tRNA 4-thiouridine(8) synthase ThiI [Candidatus Omnitrophica bacterium]|nr:tRNA 4-thiouridine(8) synthase ThiI [Candidatus Omnitrophota bacterium]